MLTAFLIRLVMAMIGLMLLGGGMVAILALCNKMLDVDFKKAFDKIEEDPKAMALFYGLEKLGAFIAIGLVVCAALIV